MLRPPQPISATEREEQFLRAGLPPIVTTTSALEGLLNKKDLLSMQHNISDSSINSSFSTEAGSGTFEELSNQIDNIITIHRQALEDRAAKSSLGGTIVAKAVTSGLLPSKIKDDSFFRVEVVLPAMSTSSSSTVTSGGERARKVNARYGGSSGDRDVADQEEKALTKQFRVSGRHIEKVITI